MQVGELIKRFREQRSLTQRAVALRSGISNATISRIEAGLVLPDTRTLTAIGKALNVNLLNFANKDDIDLNNTVKTKGKWIPVYGEIAAGIPIEAIEDIVDEEEISADMAASGEHIALRIKGDSMSPRIQSGDVVIIRLQPQVENGEVAAVLVNGDSATLKVVRKEKNGLWLFAANPAYLPVFYSSDECEALPISIIGKMVEFRGKSL